MKDEELEGRVSLMQDVIRTIRSLKQDYLPPKARPEGILLSRNRAIYTFYCLSVNVIVKDAEVTDSLRNFQDTITTLSQISKLAVHNFHFFGIIINCWYCSSFSLKLLPATAAPPRGSTMLTVGSQLEVYMQLEGMVDVDKEIDRLQKLVMKKTTQMVKITKRVEGYDDKVECNKGWSL